jgi:2-methylisocitrate lyase-like PEP mutase family enzyme
MVAKVEAAVAARYAPGFLIIARTDARAPEGLEAAIARGRAYRDAGADVLFIEAPQSVEEIETIAGSFEDVPLLFNYAEGGKTPPVTREQLRRWGFSIVIFPISTLLVATAAIRAALNQIKRDGTPIELLSEMLPFNDFLDFIGMPEIRALEKRFASAPTKTTTP